MRVKELRELLSHLPDDMDLWVTKSVIGSKINMSPLYHIYGVNLASDKPIIAFGGYTGRKANRIDLLTDFENNPEDFKKTVEALKELEKRLAASK